MTRELMQTDTPPRTAEMWRAALVDPDDGIREQRDQGRHEFEDFVLRTWEGLVVREKKATNAKPSICLFCRMDVGIRITNGKFPSYFVNEVERTQTMSLWLQSIVDKRMGTLMDTFALVLQQWLRDSRNPYIL